MTGWKIPTMKEVDVFSYQTVADLPATVAMLVFKGV